MKKVLLSILAAAVTTVAFAQAPAPAADPTNGEISGNVIGENGDEFTFLFKGNAAANCLYGVGKDTVKYPVEVSSVWIDHYGGEQDPVAFQITAAGNGRLTYVIKAGTVKGTNLKFRFPTTTCDFASQVVDLSNKDKQGFQIDYTVSSDLKVAVLAMGNMKNGGAGNPSFGDLNIQPTTFTAGSGTAFGILQDSTYLLKSANLNLAGGFALQLVDDIASDITLTFTGIRIGVDNATVGVVDYTYAKNSVVYPNPVSSNEELTVTGLSGNVSLRLLNATGNVVTSSSDSKLQLNNLNAGLYFLEVNNNGTLKTEKVMVK
jgi:hypothetical protein